MRSSSAAGRIGIRRQPADDDRAARQLNFNGAALALGFAADPRIAEALLTNGQPAYVADQSGKLIYANDGYHELLEVALWSNPGTTGDEDHPILSPDALTKALDEGEPVGIKQTLDTEPMPRHLRSLHFPIAAEDGESEVLIGGVYYDISRESALAKRVTNTQERFDDITRLISDWVWEVDKDFNLTFVSARVMQVFGIHPRLMLDTSLFDIGSFMDAGRDTPDLEWRAPFRDKLFSIVGVEGKPRQCHVSGMPVFDSVTGAFAGFRGTANDITAQLEAEARATAAQTRLYDAIESSSQAFALFDAENRLVVCNEKFCEYHPTTAALMTPGVSFEELITAGAERGQFSEDRPVDCRGAGASARPRGCVRTTPQRWALVAGQRPPDGGWRHGLSAHRHQRPQAARGSLARGAGGRRIGEPHKIRIPRQHEP